MTSPQLTQALSQIAAALNGLVSTAFEPGSDNEQRADEILRAAQLAADGNLLDALRLLAKFSAEPLLSAQQMNAIADDLPKVEGTLCLRKTIEEIKTALGRSEASLLVLRFSALGERDGEDFSKFCTVSKDGSYFIKGIHDRCRVGKSLRWTLSDFTIELPASQFPLHILPEFRQVQLQGLINLGYNLRVKFTDASGDFSILF